MRYLHENSKKFEMSGVKRWHEKGYTGKGIRIANLEGTDPLLPFFHGKVRDPFSNVTAVGRNYHGHQTMDVLHQVAPDADLYTLSSNGRYGHNIAEGPFIKQSIPFMEKENIHLVNASLGGNTNPILKARIEKAKERGVTFVTSAGNAADSGVGGFARSGAWIAVGAVHLSAKGEITHASYSSLGQEVDFTQFSGIFVHDARKGYEDRMFPVNGTSFSSPMLCGMLALVQQLFLEKVGRTLYQDELYKFMQDYSIDLWQPGKDIKSGYGLFLLPNNPHDIHVGKYILHKQEVNKELKTIKMDAPAEIKNGRFYVIGRPFVEALGGKVVWDQNEPQKGIFELNGRRIILENGSDLMYIKKL